MRNLISVVHDKIVCLVCSKVVPVQKKQLCAVITKPYTDISLVFEVKLSEGTLQNLKYDLQR
jgi:hypothetical protein